MNVIFRENVEQIREDFAFYETYYDVVQNFCIQIGDKKNYLEDGEKKKNNRQCRFCGMRAGELNKFKMPTSFKLEAHAIPQSLGNRSLLSKHECDACNKYFGNTIEDDFGKWIKPIRTLSLIRGKKGVPTLTHGTNGDWVTAHPPPIADLVASMGPAI